MADAAGRPRVSVLLPVRDAAETLPAALESVARQSLADFECLVVDDGSRDASPGIAAARAAADPRFRALRTGPEGLVPALRHGLAAARAPLIARMDGDDLMHRDRLRRQVRALREHPEWSAVGCHVRLFPRAPLTPNRRAYERWLNAVGGPADVVREAFIECPVAHPTLIMRRDVLARLGYRDVPWPEDWDLLHRWLAAGEGIGIVPERLHHWRDRPGRLSRTDPRYGLDRFTACRAAFLAAGPLRSHDRYVLWGYGGTGKALARALRDHGKTPSHVVELHPGRIGQRIRGAPVVSPEALPELPQVPLVVSVAGAGPRAAIRRVLLALGRREPEDFVCAA